MRTIFYTAPGCPYCLIVKNYLLKNNIKFEEINISKSEKDKSLMIKKSKQSAVPVVDVDGAIIIGYDLRKLKESLQIK